MPSGVYERKPHMRTCGKLAGMHDYIVRLRDTGMPIKQMARHLRVSKSSVQKVLRGDWNPGRSCGQAAEPAVIRAHDRRAA